MQGMVMILFVKCNQAETYAKKHNRRSSDFHYTNNSNYLTLPLLKKMIYILYRGSKMPELKRFDGIVIYLMFNDIQHHNKPHVHVFYGEFRASVAIDGTILAGELPAKQLKAVQDWLKKNEEKAYAAWNLAVQNKHFDKIDS